MPVEEPTVSQVAQVRQILAACNPKLPQEELAVQILVGSGIRESELCGLAVVRPDGLPDLTLDSVARGRVELRVRWDGGAKGRKSRRVPITPKLAADIKRYEARAVQALRDLGAEISGTPSWSGLEHGSVTCGRGVLVEEPEEWRRIP